MPNLAVFDLDHTLLNTDSDVQWATFLSDYDYIDGQKFMPQRDKFYQDYLLGCLDMDEFLAFQLAPLAQFPRTKLDEMHKQFLSEYIRPHITTKARELVQKHHNAGDTLVLLSATNEFIITPIAHEFGIQNVIGVSLETNDAGNYTGRYIGIPSFQQGKVLRLKEWLSSQNKTLQDFNQTYFYSDSHNDLPLLEIVSNPVAVNPDEQLLKVAQEKHWVILDFLS